MNTLADIFVDDWLGMWHWHMAVRLLIAACLGGLVGAERKSHGAAAGFRTQILICTGSAMAMVVSISFARIFTGDPSESLMSIDPARIAYGVMAGIGFLGAGAIIQSKTGIKGITTAASCWCTAAIGLACGLGLMLPAISATLIVLFTLFFLRYFDTIIRPHCVRRLTVKVREAEGDILEKIIVLLNKNDISTKLILYERMIAGRDETITLRVSVPRSVCEATVMALIEDLPGVTQIQLRN